jgi:hypothetical protein
MRKGCYIVMGLHARGASSQYGAGGDAPIRKAPDQISDIPVDIEPIFVAAEKIAPHTTVPHRKWPVRADFAESSRPFPGRCEMLNQLA